MNRTQASVLGFFGLAWASLVVLFALAPEVYGRALRLSSAGARLLFLVAISAFIALLGIGVIRRWRWAFWLIFVAFLFGPLRVVASVLALSGVLTADGPTWYVLYQALLGLVQFVIALAMLAGYRRAGAWGAF
jgi:hypothetical protein